MKALEVEPEDRWARAREMAHQLEIWLGPSGGQLDDLSSCTADRCILEVGLGGPRDIARSGR